jgi:ADP-heptose:LPS heptosyltransferase
MKIPENSDRRITKKLAQEIQAGKPVKIIFRNGQAPGDILTLTVGIRDLKLAYPNIQICMRTSCGEIWENNKHIQHIEDDDADLDIYLHYPLVDQSNQCGKHMIHGFKEYIEDKLRLNFPVTDFACDIHISDEENGWINQVEENFGYKGNFWLINSGSKGDFPLKQWRRDRWQEVVDRLNNKIVFVQVGQNHHKHEALKGVINLLGKTDLRQLIRLAYKAEGAVCHITMINHLMSAWKRPCVVIGGGLEGPIWESYQQTTYLNTVGMLKCCWGGGCCVGCLPAHRWQS